MFEPSGVDFTTAKKNINEQATNVLHDIVYAYETGVFDDPKASALFCALLACICEGKVEGALNEESAKVLWSLTESYSNQLEVLKSSLLRAGIESGKVVKGPWHAR